MRTTISIPVTLPKVNALQVVLAHRRGRLKVEQDKPRARRDLKGRTLRILLKKPISKEAVISFKEGDQVRIASTEALLASKADIRRAGKQLKRLFSTSRETSFKEIVAWRKSRENGRFQTEKQFFNVFDERTYVQDADQKKILALLDRIFERRRAGDAASVLDLERTADKKQVQKFSRLFKETIEEVYGKPATGYILEVEDAFDRFSRGELSLLDDKDSPDDAEFEEYRARACQPNSTYYLYFAEFASLCIQKGVDKALWEKLLPALVQTQQSFFETYKGANGDPLPPSALLGRKWAPAKPVDVYELHRQRQAFKKAWSDKLDAVRLNYARTFVQL